MNNAERQELINAACAVRRNAYAPYSNFAVGAALRTAGGTTFVGCNVENASYGMTLCAERAAVAAAIAAAERHFMALALATPGGHPPCGACRQVLAEFDPDLPIVLINADQPKEQVEVRLGELLPRRFGLEGGGRRAEGGS